MTKEEIGALVKAKREEQGITLNALTLKAHLLTGKVHTHEQLKGIENGTKGYKLDTLLTVCEILGLEVSVK